MSMGPFPCRLCGIDMGTMAASGHKHGSDDCVCIAAYRKLAIAADVLFVHAANGTQASDEELDAYVKARRGLRYSYFTPAREAFERMQLHAMGREGDPT